MGALRRRLPRNRGEDGQLLILMIGLVVLLFMVLALGWDTSNWFLGRRALNNLADGAAVAAGNELDTTAYYRSEGRTIDLLTSQAAATVGAYMQASAHDSGVRGVQVKSVRVGRGTAGPTVTVRLAAPAQVIFLAWIGLVPPSMAADATATTSIRPA
jgi:Flp pilus assembly protein TadG